MNRSLVFNSICPNNSWISLIALETDLCYWVLSPPQYFVISQHDYKKQAIANRISKIKAKWKYPIKRASLFGSYARQEARKESDIDILVAFSSSISLLQFVNIQLELEDILGKKVDLVEFNTIKPQLKANILKEQIAIYG